MEAAHKIPAIFQPQQTLLRYGLYRNRAGKTVNIHCVISICVESVVGILSPSWSNKEPNIKNEYRNLLKNQEVEVF